MLLEEFNCPAPGQVCGLCLVGIWAIILKVPVSCARVGIKFRFFTGCLQAFLQFLHP